MRAIILLVLYHGKTFVWATQIILDETDLIYKNIRVLARKISKVGKQVFLDHNKII